MNKHGKRNSDSDYRIHKKQEVDMALDIIISLNSYFVDVTKVDGTLIGRTNTIVSFFLLFFFFG